MHAGDVKLSIIQERGIAHPMIGVVVCIFGTKVAPPYLATFFKSQTNQISRPKKSPDMVSVCDGGRCGHVVKLVGRKTTTAHFLIPDEFTRLEPEGHDMKVLVIDLCGDKDTSLMNDRRGRPLPGQVDFPNHVIVLAPLHRQMGFVADSRPVRASECRPVFRHEVPFHHQGSEYQRVNDFHDLEKNDAECSEWVIGLHQIREAHGNQCVFSCRDFPSFGERTAGQARNLDGAPEWM